MKSDFEPTELDVAVAMKAIEMIGSKECPRHIWHTWDSFAGRMIEHEESTESWTRRLLREAREKIATN